MHKQNRNRLIDTKNRLMVTKGDGLGGLGDKGVLFNQKVQIGSYKIVMGM